MYDKLQDPFWIIETWSFLIIYRKKKMPSILENKVKLLNSTSKFISIVKVNLIWYFYKVVIISKLLNFQEIYEFCCCYFVDTFFPLIHNGLVVKFNFLVQSILNGIIFFWYLPISLKLFNKKNFNDIHLMQSSLLLKKRKLNGSNLIKRE